jgi:hypothetical protein
VAVVVVVVVVVVDGRSEEMNKICKRMRPSETIWINSKIKLRTEIQS